MTTIAYARASHILTTPWGVGATLAIPAPEGRNTADFVGGVVHRAMPIGYPALTTDSDSLGVILTDTAVGLVNRGYATIPAGVKVFVELALQPSGDGAPLPAGTTRMRSLKADLGAPAAADATAIALSQDCSAATGLSAGINGALASGGEAAMDVPRNVVASWTGTAKLTVHGVDRDGLAISETSAAGTTMVGRKAFARVTDVTASADITGLTVGTGTKLGLPVHVSSAADVLAVIADGAISSGSVEAGTLAAPTPTTPDRRGTVDPDVPPDGVTRLSVILAVAAIGAVQPDLAQPVDPAPPPPGPPPPNAWIATIDPLARDRFVLDSGAGNLLRTGEAVHFGEAGLALSVTPPTGDPQGGLPAGATLLAATNNSLGDILIDADATVDFGAYDLTGYRLEFQNNSVAQNVYMDYTSRGANYLGVTDNVIDMDADGCRLDTAYLHFGGDWRHVQGKAIKFRAGHGGRELSNCHIVGSGTDILLLNAGDGDDIHDNAFIWNSALAIPRHPDGDGWVASPSTPYNSGDAVRHNDAFWISDIDSNTDEPGVANWTLVASGVHADILNPAQVVETSTTTPTLRRNYIAYIDDGNFSGGKNDLMRAVVNSPGTESFGNFIVEDNYFSDDFGDAKISFGFSGVSNPGRVQYRNNIRRGAVNAEDFGADNPLIDWAKSNRFEDYQTGEIVAHAVPDDGAGGTATVVNDKTDTATLTLSGTTDAPDGHVIEARLIEYYDDNQPSPDTATGVTIDWAGVGTASGGAWSGTVSAPRNVGTYWRAEVRAQGSTGVSATSRFAAGHVLATWEQSNVNKAVNQGSSNAPAAPAVTHPGDLMIARLSDTAMISVDDTWDTQTPAVPAMANSLSALAPGQKFAIAFHTVSGEGPAEALTDGGVWPWQDNVALNNLITGNGATNVGTVICAGWIAWNNGAKNTGDRIARYFLGKGLDGTPTDPATEGVPRLFTATHGGIYDFTVSKFAWAGPHGRAAVTLADSSTVTTMADLPDVDPLGYDELVAELQANMGRAHLPETIAFTHETIGAQRGKDNGTGGWEDTAHFSAEDRYGQMRFLEILAGVTLRTIGLAGYPLPAINRRKDATDGSYVDFWIDGFDLTTERLRAVAAGGLPAYFPATLDTSYPHWSEVMGFSVNFRPALASIVADAGGSGYAGVRVTMPAGTDPTIDRIDFGVGSLPGVLAQPDDWLNGTFLNLPVVDTGQAHIPAVPVQPRSTDGLETTLPIQPQFTTVGTYFLRDDNGGNLGSGVTAQRWEAVGRLDTDTGSEQYIFFNNTNNCTLRVRPDGAIWVEVDGGLVIQTAADTITIGVTYEYTFVVDRANDVVRLDLDGATIGERSAAQGNALGLSGEFQASRPLGFLAQADGSKPAHGTWERLEIWLNDPDGTGASFKRVEGDAEIVNSDPWKLGPDVTSFGGQTPAIDNLVVDGANQTISFDDDGQVGQIFVAVAASAITDPADIEAGTGAVASDSFIIPSGSTTVTGQSVDLTGTVEDTPYVLSAVKKLNGAYSDVVTDAFTIPSPFAMDDLFASGETGAYFTLNSASVYADTAGTTAATNGSDVQRITDQSPNGNDFIWSNAGPAAPTFEDSTEKWMVFDGSGQQIDIASLTLNSDQVTLIVAGDNTGGVADRTWATFGDEFVDEPAFNLKNSSNATRLAALAVETGGTLRAADSATGYNAKFVAICKFDTQGAVSITVNGSEVVGDTFTSPETFVSNFFNLGTRAPSSPGVPMIGKINSVAVLGRLTTAQEDTEITDLLSSEIGGTP